MMAPNPIRMPLTERSSQNPMRAATMATPKMAKRFAGSRCHNLTVHMRDSLVDGLSPLIEQHTDGFIQVDAADSLPD